MVDIKVPTVATVLNNLGLQPNGAAQVFVTNTAKEMMKPFVPVDNNALRSLVFPVDSFTALVYQSPYAHYQYMGKLYVDPITGKGSFFNQNYGHWSRPNVNKVPSERELKYHGGLLTGPKWDERMIEQRGEEFIRAIQAFIDRGKK